VLERVHPLNTYSLPAITAEPPQLLNTGITAFVLHKLVLMLYA
jgi:hypothetical protein